jgi:putative membrane protein
VASHVFSGRNSPTYLPDRLALLLGFANAIVKPLLSLLTLPLTPLTFGLFIWSSPPMMLLVARRSKVKVASF